MRISDWGLKDRRFLILNPQSEIRIPQLKSAGIISSNVQTYQTGRIFKEYLVSFVETHMGLQTSTEGIKRYVQVSRSL
jgi:hypothetical protein